MMKEKKISSKLPLSSKFFVISGPSGVGKNSVVKSVCEKGKAVRAVTATTRPPRSGEKNGEDYFFVSERQFNDWLSSGELIERNYYGGHWYGTPVSSIEKADEKGKPVLLVIDVNGALELKKYYEEVKLVFLAPPSMEELQNRLRTRGDEDEETVQKRLEIAKKELEMKNEYDCVIINDDLPIASDKLEQIICYD